MTAALQVKRVLFENEALNYTMGKEMYHKMKNEGHQVGFLKSHNRVTGIPGSSPREAFFQGKSTLVVGVRKTLDFAGCKPSAHYQLPLVTGCQGICEYCYLNTQLGKKPYTRVYVNIEEILQQARKYIDQRKPEITIFEAAATSDPIPVEPYTGALAQTIEFMAGQQYGRLRFVTKFPQVESLLPLDHRQHTRIRFSLNTDSVVKRYEHRTPPVQDRLRGLNQVLEHNYPAGVIIAPVLLDSGWQDEYGQLLALIRDSLPPSPVDFHFEIISHRFTRRARATISEVFPQTSLPMEEDDTRRYQYGQFGYGKFVYNRDLLAEMKAFFSEKIAGEFPGAVVDYII